MTPEEVLAKLRPGRLIRLSSSGQNPSGQGYVGDIFDDHFEFLKVTNPFQHFSNISAPAETIRYTVHFKDVNDIQFDPWD